MELAACSIDEVVWPGCAATSSCAGRCASPCYRDLEFWDCFSFCCTWFCRSTTSARWTRSDRPQRSGTRTVAQKPRRTGDAGRLDSGRDATAEWPYPPSMLPGSTHTDSIWTPSVPIIFIVRRVWDSGAATGSCLTIPSITDIWITSISTTRGTEPASPGTSTGTASRR
jgi:hypothetical protein